LEQTHEPEVHVQDLVTVEQGCAGIVGNEIGGTGGAIQRGSPVAPAYSMTMPMPLRRSSS